MLPGAARAGIPVEHDEVRAGRQTRSAQVERTGQAGLPSADHDDVDVDAGAHGAAGQASAGESSRAIVASTVGATR